MKKKEDLEKEVKELQSDIKQIKEVLNIIIGMMSEDEMEEDDAGPPFHMKTDVDMSMLN